MKHLLNVEKNVTPLEEVFRLQGAEELARAEQVYLHTSEKNKNSIILVRQSGAQPLVLEQIKQLKIVWDE